MIAFLRNILLTVAALSALWWIGGIIREVHTLDPRRLPDHDFLPEISRLMAAMAGMKVVKSIVIKKKIVNFVVKPL